MRRLFLLVGLLCLSIPAIADQITLTWNAKPADQTWTEVRIYEKLSAVAYNSIATVPGDQTTVTFNVADKAAHSYVVRSYNGQRESNDSEVATLEAAPNPPSGLKISKILIASTGIGAVILLIVWLAHRHKK
jgi:hypothetical protein